MVEWKRVMGDNWIWWICESILSLLHVSGRSPDAVFDRVRQYLSDVRRETAYTLTRTRDSVLMARGGNDRNGLNICGDMA